MFCPAFETGAVYNILKGDTAVICVLFFAFIEQITIDFSVF